MNVIYQVAFALALTVLIGLCSAVMAEDQGCDFTLLTQELPLLSKYTEEITEKARNEPKTWELLKSTLPNIRKAYVSRSPYFFVGFGWQSTDDSMDKFSRDQVEILFQKTADIAMFNASKQGQKFNSEITRSHLKNDS